MTENTRPMTTFERYLAHMTPEEQEEAIAVRSQETLGVWCYDRETGEWQETGNSETSEARERAVEKFAKALAAEDETRLKVFAADDAYYGVSDVHPNDSSSDAQWAAFGRHERVLEELHFAEEKTDSAARLYRARAWERNPEKREQLIVADLVYDHFKSADHEGHETGTRWGCSECGAAFDKWLRDEEEN